MLSKTFLKIICVSVFGTSAFMGASVPSYSQPAKLEDPGYGLHMQGLKNEVEKKKTESGLTFTSKELNQWAIRLKRSTDKYDQRVSKVMSGRENIEFAMGSLRVLYPRTSHYDPFGDITIRKMTAFAYVADMSDDQKEVNDALDSYRDLLYKHIVNLNVIEYALTLARANPIYGNKIRLQKIYRQLLREIDRRDVTMGSSVRTGRDPGSSFRIVTYGEETYLLGLHNVTVQKSEIYKVNKRFYNVHDVVDEEGQYYQFYFDVTWPIFIYEKNKAVRDRAEQYSIPAQ